MKSGMALGKAGAEASGPSPKSPSSAPTEPKQSQEPSRSCAQLGLCTLGLAFKAQQRLAHPPHRCSPHPGDPSHQVLMGQAFRVLLAMQLWAGVSCSHCPSCSSHLSPRFGFYVTLYAEGLPCRELPRKGKQPPLLCPPPASPVSTSPGTVTSTPAQSPGYKGETACPSCH